MANRRWNIQIRKKFLSGGQAKLDANKDGIPDSQTPVTSVALAAGESVNLIVQATTASNNVTAGDLGKLTVSAISGFDTIYKISDDLYR